MGHKPEVLYFEPIKEPRSGYFVEYQPAGEPCVSAVLSIIFPEAVPEQRSIARVLETEAREWLARYPVPIMAGALDSTESLIKPTRDVHSYHLFAWIDPRSREPVTSWVLEDLTKHQEEHALEANLRTVYRGIRFKTQADVKANAERYIREQQTQRRALILVLTLWIAVLPAAWATLEFLGPEWLSTAVFAFTLWKAYGAWRKMMGYLKPSPAETQEAEKQRKMEHYFYHCERNPLAFERLKADKFAKSITEQTQKEARALNKTTI